MKKLHSNIEKKIYPYSGFPRITEIESLPKIKVSRFSTELPVINKTETQGGDK